MIVTTYHCPGNTAPLGLFFVPQRHHSSFLLCKMFHPDFLSYPTSMMNIQGERNPGTCAPCVQAGQEAWWILKAAFLFVRPSVRRPVVTWSCLLSTMPPPSLGPHCCVFCFNKPEQLLSFYCIQNSKSRREKAAEKNTGPAPLHFKAAFLIIHTGSAGVSSVPGREPNSPGDFPQ